MCTYTYISMYFVRKNGGNPDDNFIKKFKKVRRQNSGHLTDATVLHHVNCDVGYNLSYILKLAAASEFSKRLFFKVFPVLGPGP